MSGVEQEYLLGSLERAYLEARMRFEEIRASDRNKKLYKRMRNIIQVTTRSSSDKIRLQQGAIVEGDTVTITAASLFDEELLPGETTIDKQTDWIPYGKKGIKGISRTVDFSLRFSSRDYVRLTDEICQSRQGCVSIEGRLSDDDGVESTFPLAYLQKDSKTSRMLLLYNFGSEIPYGSDNDTEIIRMVTSAEQQLGINETQ